MVLYVTLCVIVGLLFEPTFSQGSTNCGKTFNNTGGVIFYTNLKNRSIPHDISCNFTIISTSEIILHVELLLLGDSDDFTILDDSGHAVFGPFNGKHGSFIIATGLHEVNLILETSQNVLERAFSVKFSSGECKYNENNIESLYLSSPLYNPKRKNWPFECSFDLRGKGITKPLVMMAVEFANVSLNNSSLEFQPQNRTYFNVDFPHKLLLKSPLYLVMRFNQTDYMQHFMIKLDLVSEACSGSINLKETNPYTISFSPKMYNDDRAFARLKLSCFWILNSPLNTRIVASLDEIFLPSQDDRLVLKSPRPENFSPVLLTSVSQNNGNSIGATLVSDSNEFWVAFSTLHNHEGLKFKLKFSIQVDGELQEEAGQVTIKSSKEYKFQVASTDRVFVRMSSTLKGSTTMLILYSSFTRLAEPFLNISAADFHLKWFASPTSQLRIIILDFNEPQPLKLTYSSASMADDCFSIGIGAADSFLLSDSSSTCRELCEWLVPRRDFPMLFQIHVSNAKVELKSLTIHKKPVILLSVPEDKKSLTYQVLTPAFTGFLLHIERKCDNPSKGSIKASFSKEKSCSRDLRLIEGETVEVASPGYPDNCPVNSKCEITLQTDFQPSRFLVTFSQLSLAPDQFLYLKSDFESFNVSGKTNWLPHDSIFPGSLEVLFQGLSQSTGKFSFRATALGCGGNERKAKGKLFLTGEYCVWKVVLPHKDHSKKILLRVLNGTGNTLTIFDGPSTAHPRLQMSSSGETLSSGNAVIIIHRALSKSDHIVEVQYKTHVCSQYCNNGHCMEKDWKCNGINECGDYSDELYCKQVSAFTSNSDTTALPTVFQYYTPQNSSELNNNSKKDDIHGGILEKSHKEVKIPWHHMILSCIGGILLGILICLMGFKVRQAFTDQKKEKFNHLKFKIGFC